MKSPPIMWDTLGQIVTKSQRGLLAYLLQKVCRCCADRFFDQEVLNAERKICGNPYHVSER